MMQKSDEGFIIDEVEGKKVELLGRDLGGDGTKKLPSEWADFEEGGFKVADLRTVYHVLRQAYYSDAQDDAVNECRDFLLGHFQGRFFASGVNFNGLRGMVWHEQPSGRLEIGVNKIPHGMVEQEYDHINDMHRVRKTGFALSSPMRNVPPIRNHSRELEGLFQATFGAGYSESTRVLEYFAMGTGMRDMRTEDEGWEALRVHAINGTGPAPQITTPEDYWGLGLTLPIDRNRKTSIGVDIHWYGIGDNEPCVEINFDRSYEATSKFRVFDERPALGVREAN